MQNFSKDFPEIPGESIADRKVRRRRWKTALQYQARLDAGLCGRCGRGKPVSGSSTCQACRGQIAKRNKWRDSNPDVCSKCTRCAPEPGKSCCRPCLDLQKEQNKKRRSKPIGNWIDCVRRATREIALGEKTSNRRTFRSKWLAWDRFEFEKVFSDPKPGADLDHIIPLACADLGNGEVDQEFGRLASNLGNLQYISHQANVLKFKNQDTRAIQRSKELRGKGLQGSTLFLKLWQEFAWPDRQSEEL